MSINISASLIKDYLTCRAKVFSRINYPETSIPNREMVLGSIVHKLIEKYPLITYKTFEELETFGLIQEEILFCTSCLENYQDNFLGFLKNDGEVEKQFRIPFQDGVYIVGKMDRVTKDGIVIDWKTNRRVPKTINNDPQFILYHWAYTKLYNNPPQAVYYASLPDGSLLMLNYFGYYYKYLFDKIIPSIVSDIKNNNLPKTGIFTKDCYRCPYREACLQEENHELDSTKDTKR